MIQVTQRWAISFKITIFRRLNTHKKCSNFGGKCVTNVSLVGKPNYLYILKINYGHGAHQILCLVKTNYLMCFESGYNKNFTIKIEKC